MTRDLLAFSARQVRQPHPVDVDGVIRDLQPGVERLLPHGVQWELDLGAACRVHADAGQLERVVVNLVTNACDAMASGGRLTVSTRRIEADEAAGLGLRPEKHVALEVSDTGTGMDDETLARAFDPFFSTKALGRGTGLGLPTVRGMVEQSGGEIRVKSDVGKGTTVTVFLPCAAAGET